MTLSFSSVTAVARTSNTVLKKSGVSMHSCFVPGLRGKTFWFSLFSMMFVVGLSYKLFTMFN